MPVSHVIDLSTLATGSGFIIQGDAPGDQAGFSVSSAGDVNNDGIDDLIVGAPRGDDGGTDAGEAYVVYGTAGATRGPLDLSAIGQAEGFIIQGDAAGAGINISVSSAGDVNDDGIDDLIVGAPLGSDAYVVYGQAGATRGPLDLTGLAAADGFAIFGGGQVGGSVSSAGDVNGDGIDDLIIGARYAGGSNTGEAYIIYGVTGATRTAVNLVGLTAATGFVLRGDGVQDRFGFSVSSAGDLNGDGIGDLIVGARNGDAGGLSSGEAYVIYGQAGATRGLLDVTGLSAGDGFIIQGDAAGDTAGYSVSSAGDVNGDGIADLIVGAPGGDDGGSNAGEAYVIYGTAGPTRGTVDLTTLAATDGFIIQGDAQGDGAGLSVSSAGDVNGDGIDDLIIGAPNGDDAGNLAGEAYVIYGKLGAARGVLDLTGLDQADGFILQGDAAGDEAGFSVSSAGDVNNDGFDDLIVGARFGDDGGLNAGEAYVVYGFANNSAPVITSFGGDAVNAFSVSEGSNSASFYEATDPDPDTTLTWSISGVDAAFFFIDPLTGLLGFFGPDHEDPLDAGRDNVYNVTVQVSDGSLTDAQAVIATVVDARERTRLDLTTGDDTYSNTATIDKLVLDGLAGNDTITTGLGADTVFGNLGNDVIATGAGNDVITYRGRGGGFDRVDGGAGANDEVRALGNNALIGLLAVTRIETVSANGFAGVSILSDAANNTLDFSTVTLTGITLIDMFDGDDRVTGSAAADTIRGGTGNDTISGGDGDDVLLIGQTAGIDSIAGGAGVDRILADGTNRILGLSSLSGIEEISANGFAGFIVTGSDASDTLDFSATLLTDIAFIDGGLGADSITGNTAANTLSGGFGNDTVLAGDGDDVILVAGDGGNDSVDGGSGFDAIRASANAVTIGWGSFTGVEAISSGGFSGTRLLATSLGETVDLSALSLSGITLIDGGDGSDTIIGSAGADTITGGLGNAIDTLQGGAGNDVLIFGAAGADIYIGGGGSDTLRAGGLNARLDWNPTNLVSIEAISGGGFGGVRITGTGAADTIDLSPYIVTGIAAVEGGGGNDTMIGSSRADTLVGGVGSDTLTGGAGADSLTGSAGADVFDFNLVVESRPANIDTITDFVQGSDRIDLTTIDANTLVAGNQAFTFGTLAETGFGTGTLGSFTTNLADGTVRTEVIGNIDGGPEADLHFFLTGAYTLTAADFLL